MISYASPRRLNNGGVSRRAFLLQLGPVHGIWKDLRFVGKDDFFGWNTLSYGTASLGPDGGISVGLFAML